MMVVVPKVALFAKSCVVETVEEKYPYVEVTAEPVAFKKVRLPSEDKPVMVREPALIDPADRAVTVPLAAERFVADRFVVVTFVVVTFPRTAFQRSVSLPSV